jgi:hypothetical protein
VREQADGCDGGHDANDHRFRVNAASAAVAFAEYEERLRAKDVEIADLTDALRSRQVDLELACSLIKTKLDVPGDEDVWNKKMKTTVTSTTAETAGDKVAEMRRKIVALEAVRMKA